MVSKLQYGVVSCVLVLLLICHLCESKTEGQEAHDIVKRTIGGARFRRGQWPWLTLLRATIVTERLFGIFPISHYHLYCGGVLISDRWILSAAHCFRGTGRGENLARNWEARLATIRLRPDIRQRVLDIIGRVLDANALRIWEIDVDRIVVHPSYNVSGLYTDDIALVRLSRSVPNTQRFPLIRNVTLPSPEDSTFPSPGQECITKGWGCTARGGGPSQIARQIEMPIYPNSRCSIHYGLSTMNHRICAGYRNQNIGVCKGDSGSPLVCRKGDNYVLAGIVSFTSRNQPESFPAVFTKVQDYLPWIEEVTGLSL